jgi:hypothetical protein
MLNMQPYYRLVITEESIVMVKIQLSPRVIYPKEFYQPDLVYHYFKTLIPGIANRELSRIFLFTGQRGTGKTSFVRWMVGGLHKRRPVVFLEGGDLDANNILFLEKSLSTNPQMILAMELDGVSEIETTELIKRLDCWIERYPGVKILCIKNDDFHNFYNFPLIWVLPFFTPLPWQRVAKILKMMGLVTAENRQMTHREIFGTITARNLSWKIKQQ